jgi:hypothetical protein
MSSLPPPIPETLKAAFAGYAVPFVPGIVDHFEMELFSFYARDSEQLLEKMEAEARQYIQEQIDQGIDEINDTGLVAVDYFVKRMRRSHVIYLASLLETCLGRACDALGDILGLADWTVIAKPFGADWWTRKRRFLEIQASFQIPNATWNTIWALITLRNNLVHANGEPETLSADDRARILSLPGVRIENYEVFVEPACIDACFHAVSQLVWQVQTELNEANRQWHSGV